MGLGATTSELVLDLGLPSSSPAAARSAAGFMREAAAAGEGRAAKLEEYVRGLEEERRKIEVFRRELPLCMLILNDVIGTLKLEMAARRDGEDASGGRPVLEEFVPVKRKSQGKDGGVKREDGDGDKLNWMSSAQLWSDNSSTNTSSTTSITVATNNDAGSSGNSKKNTREGAEADRRAQDAGKPLADSKYRSGGGAFMAFKGLLGCHGGKPRKERVAADAVPFPDLSLLSPATKSSHTLAVEDRRFSWSSARGASRGTVSSAADAAVSLQAQLPASQQPPRKVRRCWSQELHRRFIDALQQLGGAQAATPRQIRELMKVDGLTNDEVKSHLQKFRLHTRRMPASSNPPAKQPVVMLGGLWLRQDGYPATKESTSHSGSPNGPLHLAITTPRMSTMRGDSCEEEDGKSESYSWKGHLQSSEETN